MTKQDALRILNLSNNYPSQAEIKAAYQNRAKIAHPDKGGTSEDFILVRRAYVFLRDELINSTANSHNSQHSQQSQYSDSSHTNQSSDSYNSSYSSGTHHTHAQHSHTNTQSDDTLSSWRARYYDVLTELENKNQQIHRIQGINKHMEGQIESIIRLFNSGQQVLNNAQRNINEHLSRLDALYNSEHARITKLYRGTFLDHVFGRKQLSYNDYVRMNNELVRHIQKQEDEAIKDYHKQIETIYQEIMTSIYNILSV